ncbi:MAG: hypothetical protein F6K04_21550, partial [Leptolyngbya sp. SIO4C5]|nr:hypothetical protein [Leptolyngbya sp. SIO4C5]
QIIDQAIATQESEAVLELLPQIAVAAQTLTGEYGVLNSKRAILIQLAQHYQKLGQPEAARPLLNQARSLLGSLQGDGFGLIVAPIAVEYSQLGDTEIAIDLLDQALSATVAMQTTDAEYRSAIFSAIAGAYAQAGAEEQALQVAAQITAVPVKMNTLSDIGRFLAESGQIAAAESALNQAWTLAQLDSSGAGLPRLALNHEAVGQPDRALEIAKAIAAPEIKVQTLAALAAQESSPEPAAAIISDLVAAARTITPFYTGDDLLRSVAVDYLATERYALALQLSQLLDATLQSELLLKLIQQASAAGEMAIAAQATEILPPGWENQTRFLAQRYQAEGYGQAGQYDQALQLLPQIGNTADYPNQALARTAIARSYRLDGQEEQAIEQLDLALRSLEILEESAAQLEALGLIAVELVQLGQPERALAIQTAALTPAEHTGSESYAIEQWIRQYLAVAAYEPALQLVTTLQNPYEHDRLLQVVLNQLLEAGDLETARRAAGQIGDANQKVASLVKTADYYRGLEQLDTATLLLEQAFTLAQALSGPDENLYTAAAQIDPSVPLVNEFDRGSLLEAIAIRYAESGQLDQALETAQALRSPADRDRLQQRLACYR